MSAKLARERATEILLNNLLPRVIFSEEPSSSIICLLCNQVLKNPMQLSCGHRVCKECEENFLPDASGQRHCPNDGELIERKFPDGSALKEIMLLECSCVAHEEGCMWKGELLELEGHVNGCDFCAEGKCPYEELQCTFSGTQQRMAAHIRDESIRHDCLVATCIKDCMDHTVSNRSVLNTIKKGTVFNDNTIQHLEAEINQLQQSIVQTSIECDPECSQQRHIKYKSEELQILLALSEEKKTKLFAMHMKIEELLANIETQIATFTNTDDANTTRETLAATRKSLLDKVKRLGEFNNSHGKQINEVGIKIRIAQCSNNNGNYTWKLDNLTKRFNEGPAGELYTPPLYTSNFGYKYSAKVILGGEKGKGGINAKYMAFYIVLMQGDYDEILQFPFPYPVEITLVNLNKRDSDITHTLYPDPNKLHFQKPYKNMNPAIGFARFCSHEKLNTGGFIKNDTIYFRIAVLKVGLDVNEPNIEPAALRP